MAKSPRVNGPADSIGSNAEWAAWFFENAQDLFITVRPQGRRILAVNPVWESATGWPAGALVGCDLFEFIWPDDIASLRAMRPKLAAKGGAIEPFRFKRRDGRWLWLEGYARQGPGGEMVAVLRDVTGERRRQLQLEQADHVQNLLSATAGVRLWRYDPRSRRFDWWHDLKNQAVDDGEATDDYATVLALCHPEDSDTVGAAIEEVIATGRPASFDHRIGSDDGGWLHMRVHVRGEALGEGLHLVYGLSQDITELVEAREAALQGERQSRRLVEQAPFAVALFDQDLRYSMASPRWIELFRLQGRSYLGERLDELAAERYDDFVRVQKLALAGQVTRSGEYELIDSLGNAYWLRSEVHPWRDAAGKIIGVVVYVDDITDIANTRRESLKQEHRLKIALGAARAAVVETDFRRGLVYSSPELMALTGYDLTGTPVGDTVWPFIHPDDVAHIDAEVRRWATGAPIESHELRIITADGAERWVRIYTEFERDGAGLPARAVNLILDIDEGKRLELALIEAERAAQAAAEAKSQFLANMSHEIRTPMNGVLGVLHLLERQPLPSESLAMLTEALACGRMLQAILDDVVDFSRIEAGRLELSDEPLDPAGVLDSVVGLLRGQAEAKGLDIRVETAGLPAWISGDPVRLRQCLFNLMGNAVKFTANGSVALRAVAVNGLGGPRVRFEIEDTGVGIDNAARERLFERFQQADATTTRRFGGSGLGLAITRKLAELMGGAVGVRSAPGVGSTFWLEVPACVVGPPQADLADVGDVLHGMRVLVVEDNPTNRMIASKILESLGAVVETAEDGEQGVAATARGGFDLILMDIQMPGIDGVEATARIRALGGPAAQTPVVALTANVLNHQRDGYLAAGMNGVVGKPISPSALLAEIARIAAKSADLSLPDEAGATSDRASARPAG